MLGRAGEIRFPSEGDFWDVLKCGLGQKISVVICCLVISKRVNARNGDLCVAYYYKASNRPLPIASDPARLICATLGGNLPRMQSTPIMDNDGMKPGRDTVLRRIEKCEQQTKALFNIKAMQGCCSCILNSNHIS